MRIINIDKHGIKKSLEEAGEILENGGVLMHPTDTCYGFAADVSDSLALIKLYAIKKMDVSKPVSIMVSSLDQALEYGVFPKKALEMAKTFWPGSLTFIVERTALLPEILNPGNKNVAIRFPDNDFCVQLVKKFGGPLTTTSANITGKPEVRSVSQYLEDNENNEHFPDMIFRNENYEICKPSSIIDFTTNHPSIVRRGENVVSLEEYIDNFCD